MKYALYRPSAPRWSRATRMAITPLSSNRRMGMSYGVLNALIPPGSRSRQSATA